MQAAKVNQDEIHGTSTPPTPTTSSPSASSKSFVPSPIEVNEYDAEEEEEAMRMAMLIAEQEEIYGVNMYDCIDHADEEQIEHLCSLGMTMDEAIYHIFDEKVVRRGERPSTPAVSYRIKSANIGSNDKLIIFSPIHHPIIQIHHLTILIPLQFPQTLKLPSQ